MIRRFRPAYSTARWNRAAGQRGVSLLLALIFVAFFGGILVTLARFNAFEIRKTEARITGWEMVEIAKAARLYVRDRLADDPTLRVTAATPTRIPLSALKSGGYLSPNFGRTVSGRDLSALSQEIFVIMTNWSSNGLGGDTDDPATVPSAFVYFNNTGKTRPDLVVEAVEAARRQGATITAPLFDINGTNRSADCRGGGPAVGLWDTGCLTQGEFATMATAIGADPTFAGGALIMPAWKAFQPDLRAVMRHPQPENPGFATMLTDLGMGTPIGDCTDPSNQIMITTLDAVGNTVSTPSDICDTVPDTAADNLRFNIDGIGNIMAERMITEPQAQDFGGDAANIGTGNDDSFRVTGDVLLGSDIRVYNVRPLPAGVTHRFDVPNGTLVVERNSYLYSQNTSRSGIATIGTATGNALITDQLDSTNFVSTTAGTTTGAATMNVTQQTTLTGTTSVIGAATAELTAEEINAAGATLSASDTTGQVQVTDTLNMQGSDMQVNGTVPIGGYAAIMGEITEATAVNVRNNLQFLTNSGSISAVSTRDYDGTPLPNVSTARCLEGPNLGDGCPNRQYFPPNITP